MLVADSHQRRGVGTLLLEHLAAVARQAGIRSFVADTLADNGLMQQVFTDAGFQVERRSDLDVTHVRMSLRRRRRRSTPWTCGSAAPTWRACGTCWPRSRSSSSGRATGRARSAAPSCGTSSPATTGGILRAVNPHRRWVQRLRAYPSVLSLPEPVDLAIVAVPGPAVEQVIRDCGERGIPAAVILSAGFGETDTETGTAAPTGSGSCCAPPARPASGWSDPTASALPCGPPTCGSTPRSGRPRRRPARSGIASQSGALGIGLLAEAAHRHIGVSGLRLARQQARRERQRPAALLGGRPGDQGHRAVPGVVRQPGEVPPARPPHRPQQADRRAQGRPHRRRRPRRRLAHGRGRDPGRGGHDAAAAGRGDPGPQHRGTARRRATAVRTTCPGRQPPRHHRQRRRTRHPRRRRDRRRRPRRPRASPATQDALRAAAPGLASARNPIDLGAAADADAYEKTIRALLASGEVDARRRHPRRHLGQRPALGRRGDPPGRPRRRRRHDRGRRAHRHRRRRRAHRPDRHGPPAAAVRLPRGRGPGDRTRRRLRGVASPPGRVRAATVRYGHRRPPGPSRCGRSPHTRTAGGSTPRTPPTCSPASASRTAGPSMPAPPTKRSTRPSGSACPWC